MKNSVILPDGDLDKKAIPERFQTLIHNLEVVGLFLEY